MNGRILEVRALDAKVAKLHFASDIIPSGRGWIGVVRQALGMTAAQLAARLGVTQPRVSNMERNENNLKISTLKKAAAALDCEFVCYFKPRTSFQDIVATQARRKAEELLGVVNMNMALENQAADTKQLIEDMVAGFINKDTKQIWD